MQVTGHSRNLVHTYTGPEIAVQSCPDQVSVKILKCLHFQIWSDITTMHADLVPFCLIVNCALKPGYLYS